MTRKHGDAEKIFRPQVLREFVNFLKAFFLCELRGCFDRETG